MTYADIAARLRDLSRQINELGKEVVAEISRDQMEAVTRVFDGQEVTPDQQRQAAEQFDQQQQNEDDLPRQVPCKFCNDPVWLQKSARTGSFYTTNTRKKNDLHRCPKRPAA